MDENKSKTAAQIRAQNKAAREGRKSVLRDATHSHVRSNERQVLRRAMAREIDWDEIEFDEEVKW